MKSSICLLSLGVFLLISTSAVHACLNPIGSRAVSEPIITIGLGPQEFLTVLLTRPDEAYWKNILSELEDQQREFGWIESRTNKAVALLHLGRVNEAIGILEDVEKEKPGQYYTAANLGTAYELNGENEKALKWIKEGINRNKDAHNGSEWLHVRILEAKLALEKDPKWLASNSVLGLHQLTDEQLLSSIPEAKDNLGHALNLKRVEEALIYQLHERLEFIKPPEAVVANLLFDLSHILARTRSAEHSAIVRQFAQSYGPELTPWVVPDPVPAVEILPPIPWNSPILLPGIATLLLIGLGGGVWLFTRQRR